MDVSSAARSQVRTGPWEGNPIPTERMAISTLSDLRAAIQGHVGLDASTKVTFTSTEAHRLEVVFQIRGREEAADAVRKMQNFPGVIRSEAKHPGTSFMLNVTSTISA